MAEDKEMFRKEAMDQLSSPEQLEQHACLGYATTSVCRDDS